MSKYAAEQVRACILTYKSGDLNFCRAGIVDLLTEYASILDAEGGAVGEAVDEIARLKGVIERDRTVFCNLIAGLKRELQTREWLGDENARAAGGYRYDEPGFIREFGEAWTAIMAALSRAHNTFRDFTDCPNGDALRAAQADAETILAAQPRAVPEGWRATRDDDMRMWTVHSPSGDSVGVLDQAAGVATEVLRQLAQDLAAAHRRESRHDDDVGKIAGSPLGQGGLLHRRKESSRRAKAPADGRFHHGPPRPARAVGGCGEGARGDREPLRSGPSSHDSGC